jgi:hypothetical protein
MTSGSVSSDYSPDRARLLYLDIDGVLLSRIADPCGGIRYELAPGATEFLAWVVAVYDCYWLTARARCGRISEVERAFRHALEVWHLPESLLETIRLIEPAPWGREKVEGIDLESDFLWVDDDPSATSVSLLTSLGLKDRLVRYGTTDAYVQDLEQLKEILQAIGGGTPGPVRNPQTTVDFPGHGETAVLFAERAMLDLSRPSRGWGPIPWDLIDLRKTMVRGGWGVSAFMRALAELAIGRYRLIFMLRRSYTVIEFVRSIRTSPGEVTTLSSWGPNRSHIWSTGSADTLLVRDIDTLRALCQRSPLFLPLLRATQGQPAGETWVYCFTTAAEIMDGKWEFEE